MSDAEDFIRRMLGESTPEPAGSSGLSAELARIANYANAVAEAIDMARPLRPRTSVGDDGSGAVAVTIDSEGQMIDVSVADDWNTRIDPRQLGASVVKAWTHALQTNIQAAQPQPGQADALERMRQFRVEDFDSTPPPQPAILRPTDRPAMSVDHLANAVLAAMEAPMPSADPAIFVGESESSDGWVTASVSSMGLTGCSIPATWALEQSSLSIRWAIMEAIAAAREKMAVGTTTANGKHADLDLLINEAINHLRSL